MAARGSVRREILLRYYKHKTSRLLIFRRIVALQYAQLAKRDSQYTKQIKPKSNRRKDKFKFHFELAVPPYMR